MTLAARLRHTLVIERTTGGARDAETGHPSETESDLATVKGWVQPKSAREVAQLSEAGVVVSDYTIFLLPTDVKAADRIRLEPDDGRRFQVTGVRDAAGRGHHLELDAHLVSAQ